MQFLYVLLFSFVGLSSFSNRVHPAVVNHKFSAASTCAKLPGDTVRAVPTFQNISLYWKPNDGSSTREALVHYRIKGTNKWQQAQSLWFDDRIPDSIGGNTERSKNIAGAL